MFKKIVCYITLYSFLLYLTGCYTTKKVAYDAVTEEDDVEQVVLKSGNTVDVYQGKLIKKQPYSVEVTHDTAKTQFPLDYINEIRQTGPETIDKAELINNEKVSEVVLTTGKLIKINLTNVYDDKKSLIKYQYFGKERTVPLSLISEVRKYPGSKVEIENIVLDNEINIYEIVTKDFNLLKADKIKMIKSTSAVVGLDSSYSRIAIPADSVLYFNVSRVNTRSIVGGCLLLTALAVVAYIMWATHETSEHLSNSSCFGGKK
ncbi:MAG: hypothetical protein Q8903_13505 [Bacteroidota bacterium]|nr:hypothetical protein [Bacteroidota bacterium]